MGNPVIRTPMADFQIGDTVHVKGGGTVCRNQPMTITEISGTLVYCVTTDAEGHRKECAYGSSMLEKMTQSPNVS